MGKMSVHSFIELARKVFDEKECKRNDEGDFITPKGKLFLI